jgi:hypothetical protein
VTEKLRPSLWRRLRNSLSAWPRGGVETFDLIPDGFVFTRRNKPVQIFWSEIVQIDAGMRDYLTLDLFFAVIHTDREKVIIDELVDGFRLLEAGVFEHWPKTRDRWLALQGGPHHWPALETLWPR